jgi:hypothetical protein
VRGGSVGGERMGGGGGDSGAEEELRHGGVQMPHGLDWSTPLLFVLMVLLYHQLVGFYT